MPRLRSEFPRNWWKVAGIAAVVIALLAVIGATAYSTIRPDATTEANGEHVVAPLNELDRIVLPQNPRMLIMGDAYTAGADAENPQQDGWAYLTARALDFPTWVVDGVPGSGFTWGGIANGDLTNRYKERIQRTAENGFDDVNILILQGGQNDYRFTDARDLTSAVVDTIETARRTWPGVQIVVMSTSIPQPLGVEFSRQNDAIAAGALATGTSVINPLAYKWFTDANSAQYSNVDGTGLNTLGHRYLAEQFLAEFAKRGGPSPAPRLPA